MAKEIVFAVIFVLFVITGNSQVPKLEYGFHGGLNLNSASGTGIDKAHKGILTGMNIGGHIKFYTGEHFGIRLLASYDQNGYAYRSLLLENSNATGVVKADILKRLNFFNVPVLAEYSFGNKVQVNIDAGFFAGFLLNNKSTTRYKEPVPPGQPSSFTSSSKGDHITNYGLSVGFGIQVPLASKIKLDLDVRNNTGLANVVRLVGNNNKIETNCLSILAGISFQL